MQVETAAEQLFFTTAYVRGKGPETSWVGTGFVHSVEVEGGTLHLLVTNKHVLAGATAIAVRMVEGKPDGGPILGRSTEITTEGMHDGLWVGHPDERVDVGVFPIGNVVNTMAENGHPPFFRAIGDEHFADAALVSELDALEPVTFIGYPAGLYDEVNFLPIARQGTTATPIAVDYAGLPAFMIDASVFQGSSGSPVFLRQQGMFATRDGNTKVGNRLALLGVLAAVQTRNVVGKIIETRTVLGVSVPEVLDLGIVYKASAIRETVDRLLKQIGRMRVSGPPTAEPGELSEVDDAVAEEVDGVPRADS